jgi:hypothetical protein
MSAPGEAHHLVAKLLTMPVAHEVLTSHRWAHEGERWQEMIFCFLTQVIPLPEEEVRGLTNRLRVLGLLDITAWAAIREASRRGAHEANDLMRRVREVLEEGGVTSPHAARGAATIHALACTVHEQFGGKVQLCLRAVGDQLLTSLLRTFKLQEISSDRTRQALTCWVQNVLNLPISLSDESIRTFCSSNGITSDELTAAADDLDVSVTVLDDLTRYWVAHAHPAAAPAQGTEKKIQPRKKSRRTAHVSRTSKRKR